MGLTRVSQNDGRGRSPHETSEIKNLRNDHCFGKDKI